MATYSQSFCLYLDAGVGVAIGNGRGKGEEK